MKERAVLYARVSTEDQATEGTSLDTQLDACRKYALANGYLVVAELREQGASGATLARPQLDKLRDMVEAGLVDVVIIFKLDRLSRDTGQTLALLKEFGKHNVLLKSPTMSLETTPEGVLLTTLLAAIGGFERAQIMERTRRGKEARVKSGRVVGTTKTPYAFRYVVGEGKYELNEDEGEIVKQIFDNVVNKGLSLYEVARRLNEQHVPTPRSGLRWRKSTILSILRNPIYCGKYCWGRTRNVAPKNPRKAGHNGETKSTNEPRPQSEWIVTPDVVVRLISDAMFDQVGAQLARNSVLSKRRCTTEYLLRGFVRCGCCGASLRGHINGKTRQYECYLKQDRNNGSSPEAQRCTSKSYHAGNLEAAVWLALEQYITTPALLRRIADLKEPEAKKAEKLEQEQRANLQTARGKVEAQLDLLLDLYVSGGLPKAKYEQKSKPLNDEVARLDRELVVIQLQAKVRDILLLPEDPWLSIFCQRMRHKVKRLTFAERRRLLELSNIKISVSGDAVHITGAFTTQLLEVSIEADLNADLLRHKGRPTVESELDNGDNGEGATDPLRTLYHRTVTPVVRLSGAFGESKETRGCKSLKSAAQEPS